MKLEISENENFARNKETYLKEALSKYDNFDVMITIDSVYNIVNVECINKDNPEINFQLASKFENERYIETIDLIIKRILEDAKEIYGKLI